MAYKVCVVGSGAREHAISQAIARSADQVIVTPGNAGIEFKSRSLGHNIYCTNKAPEDLDADLFVIGPEVPLVDGIADKLIGIGKKVFGPIKEGARLEGSKAFMKTVVSRAKVPTAKYGIFDNLSDAHKFLSQMEPPYVIKTDGLAAGKGVLVTNSFEEALADIKSKLSGESFGLAGKTVILEEGLIGKELSVMVLTDGLNVLPLPPARDAKRLRDNDEGPNTGGMGAFCPVEHLDDSLLDQVIEHFIEPTLAELRRIEIDYRGVLYAGLMLTDEGPKLLEYNVRFGDPEIQAILATLDCEFLPLLDQAANGKLRSDLKVNDLTALDVVLATKGYPDNPQVGDKIQGIENLLQEPNFDLLFAGVTGTNGELFTASGRVISALSTGEDMSLARSRAYSLIPKISFDGIQYRTDIGLTG